MYLSQQQKVNNTKSFTKLSAQDMGQVINFIVQLLEPQNYF
jgi:hypothetical protein